MKKKDETFEETNGINLLDLPELTLDHILEKLTPKELCKLACTCSYMRDKCTRDDLWEKHLKQRWGEVVDGGVAFEDWKRQKDSTRASKIFENRKFRFFINTNFLHEKDVPSVSSTAALTTSYMTFYLDLETGKYWFPAQVLNREVRNGHVGFVLSSYDARLCYDSATDDFVARYPAAQGTSVIQEDGIEWNRIRPPSVSTPPHVLHVSDCLDDLKPDDHIEIQWRKSKSFPHGWWYGVVGHIKSCSGMELNCQCSTNDTVVLEFKQYSHGSRWRTAKISRKDHREVGNEINGFYGGIRKLHKKQEIEKWRKLWPVCTLD